MSSLEYTLLLIHQTHLKTQTHHSVPQHQQENSSKDTSRKAHILRCRKRMNSTGNTLMDTVGQYTSISVKNVIRKDTLLRDAPTRLTRMRNSSWQLTLSQLELTFLIRTLLPKQSKRIHSSDLSGLHVTLHFVGCPRKLHIPIIAAYQKVGKSKVKALLKPKS